MAKRVVMTAVTIVVLAAAWLTYGDYQADRVQGDAHYRVTSDGGVELLD